MTNIFNLNFGEIMRPSSLKIIYIKMRGKAGGGFTIPLTHIKILC